MSRICRPEGVAGVDYRFRYNKNGKRAYTRLMPKVCKVCGKKYQGSKVSNTCGNGCENELISRRHKTRISKMTKKELLQLTNRVIPGAYGIATVSLYGYLCRSKLEADVVDFVADHGISFEHEPKVPESTKLADLCIKNDGWESGYYIEVDGLRRSSVRSKFGWNGKLKHYRKLVKEEKIDGFLVVTGKDYKRKLRELLNL